MGLWLIPPEGEEAVQVAEGPTESDVYEHPGSPTYEPQKVELIDALGSPSRRLGEEPPSQSRSAAQTVVLRPINGEGRSTVRAAQRSCWLSGETMASTRWNDFTST